jgi:hypothetical protein
METAPTTPWRGDEGFARLRAVAELRHNRLMARLQPSPKMPLPFPADWDAVDARQFLEDYDWFLADMYADAWAKASAERRREMEEERDMLLPFLPEAEPIPEDAS